VLIENFTWDWIYAGYAPKRAAFTRHARRLERIFSRADFHIRSEPLCGCGRGDLRVGPVSREARQTPEALRRRLGIPPGARMVLMTMGGFAGRRMPRSPNQPADDVFLVCAGSGERIQRRGRILQLPVRSGFYHPDLVQASDAVIAKLGYSTLAEVYRAGVPLGYVARDGFRESPELERFVKRNMAAAAINADELESGLWTERMEEVLALERRPRPAVDGAAEVAEEICGRYLSG
jgi:hypothetical protein